MNSLFITRGARGLRYVLCGVVGLALCAGCEREPVPATIALSVDSAEAVYAPAGEVDLSAVVRDAQGVEIPGAQLAWTVEPAAAATLDAPATDAPKANLKAVFKLSAEGQLKFTACTVSPGSEVSPVCGIAVVLVDAGAPKLVVTAPAPGAELGGEGARTIDVVGKATDPRMVYVSVNGVAAKVDAGGEFRASVAPRFGVNHVEVAASDGVSDEAHLEMDVLWGEAYGPATLASGAPGVSFDDGLVLRLGQRFFDDGTPLPSPLAHPTVASDLADLVQLVVGALDIKAQLPDPILDSIDASGNGIKLSATGAQLDEVKVEAQVVDGGLDLFVRVGAVKLDTKGSLGFAGTTVSLDGSVSAVVSAYTHVTVSKPSPTDPVKVDVATFDVALEQATSHFTDDQANAVFELASGTLRSTIEGQVKSALSGLLNGSLPGTIRNLLQSIDGALAGIRVPIDSAPLPKVTLSLDGHIEQIATKPKGNLSAILGIVAGTDREKPAFPMSRGVALTEAMPGSGAFFDSPRVQLGVRLAFLNGVLHALWNSGLLDLPASPPSLPASISGKLPPIVRMARAGEAWDLVVTLGQLEVTPSGSGDMGAFGVQIEAGIKLDIVGGTLSLAVAEEPALRIWTIRKPPDGSLYSEKLLRALLHDVVWKQVRMAIASGLSFKLPLPAIDGLTSLAPGLADLQLDLGLKGPLTLRDGYLVIDAEWSATLP